MYFERLKCVDEFNGYEVRVPTTIGTMETYYCYCTEGLFCYTVRSNIQIESSGGRISISYYNARIGFITLLYYRTACSTTVYCTCNLFINS